MLNNGEYENESFDLRWISCDDRLCYAFCKHSYSDVCNTCFIFNRSKWKYDWRVGHRAIRTCKTCRYNHWWVVKKPCHKCCYSMKSMFESKDGLKER